MIAWPRCAERSRSCSGPRRSASSARRPRSGCCCCAGATRRTRCGATAARDAYRSQLEGERHARLEQQRLAAEKEAADEAARLQRAKQRLESSRQRRESLVDFTARADRWRTRRCQVGNNATTAATADNGRPAAPRSPRATASASDVWSRPLTPSTCSRRCC
jgi:hypothetical protein